MYRFFFSLCLKNKCKRFITSAKKTLLSCYDGQFEQQEEIYFGIDFLPTRRLKIAKKCFFGGDVALSEYDSPLIIFLSVEVNVLDILSKKFGKGIFIHIEVIYPSYQLHF